MEPVFLDIFRQIYSTFSKIDQKLSIVVFLLNNEKENLRLRIKLRMWTIWMLKDETIF